MNTPTTEGLGGQGGASRSSGGRDDSRSLSSTTRRWVPPSSIKRDALTPDDYHDAVFRKIRGILNKLTPEKFDKLSDDILNIGLDSPVVIKGVIFLIFDKALKEPKYSTLYGRLCKKLAQEAPNFEPEGVTPTFTTLLLNKCENEFKNRPRVKFNGKCDRIAADVEEQRMLAKRKMLGNIKFIGELGKLEMLSNSILHKCIQLFLEKSRKQLSQESGEDIECLCQIMKTCGQILDTDKAKSLVDQYFERMVALSISPELPPRIRFMLQNVIDLRNSGWHPRKSASEQGPRTRHEIRDEAARDEGIFMPHPNQMYSGSMQHNMYHASPMMFPLVKQRKGMDDVFGSLPPGSNLGVGPGVINTDVNFMNGYGSLNGANYRNRNNESRMSNSYRGNNQYNKRNNQNKNSNFYENTPLGGHNYSNTSNKELPPRFQKMLAQQQMSQTPNSGYITTPMVNGTSRVGLSPPSFGSFEDVSLRPLPHSIIVNPKPVVRTPSAGEPMLPLPPAVVPNPPAPVLKKEVPIVIKQGSLDKSKANKKDKGPSKEETMKKINTIIDDYLASLDKGEAVSRIRGLHILDKYHGEVMASVITRVLERTEGDRINLVKLVLPGEAGLVMTQVQFMDAYKSILDSLSDLEVTLPKAKSLVASFTAHTISENFISLGQIAEPLENGTHYPMFLLLLQHLNTLSGRATLSKIFQESKINLLLMLPEVDRTKERLAEVLDDRNLTFLQPLLRIQSDLIKALQAEPDANAFCKWIKDNLDQSHHQNPAFISALVTAIMKHVTRDSTLPDIPKPDGNSKPDQAAVEKEKELTLEFSPVFRSFLNNMTELQLTAIYALQVFCYSQGFPKGMLLRWFNNLYDQEVIEEDAFLKWKEHLTDDYPGKGEALFQVNGWLRWLESAESEEEEEEEEEEED